MKETQRDRIRFHFLMKFHPVSPFERTYHTYLQNGHIIVYNYVYVSIWPLMGWGKYTRKTSDIRSYVYRATSMISTVRLLN